MSIALKGLLHFVWLFFECLNRPYPSSPQPPFQSEAKSEVMKISFHSH